MPPTGTGDQFPSEIVADAQGKLFLHLTMDDSAEVIERLRETHADVLGRAYLLRLDIIIERLGSKWETKRGLVFEHLRTSFERKFPEPNWCIRIDESSFLFVILTLGEYKGAMSMADLWYAVGQFFVGDVSQVVPPLFEAIADDVDRIRVVPIDLSKYFDRVSARPFSQPDIPLPVATIDQPAKQSAEIGTMVDVRRPGSGGALLTVGRRELRVACALEPVFEMRKLAMIGHRFEPMVSDISGHFPVDQKALSNMDWGDREKIDIINIEQGIMLLKMRSPARRKMVMIVPAAFSTFASAKGRARLVPLVTRAAQEMRLKILFEVRHLNGVPAGRISEIVAMLKPHCMTTMGHVSADTRAISGLKGCGLAGVCTDFDGERRDHATLTTHLVSLNTAARAAAGACMVQGFHSLHEMAIARLAGVSHASLKSSAIIALRSNALPT